jgi:hypothetical protein
VVLLVPLTCSLIRLWVENGYLACAQGRGYGFRQAAPPFQARPCG